MISDDVNSIDVVDIMNSKNSVDEAVVIDGDDDEIVDIPSGALIKASRYRPNNATEHVQKMH